MHISSTGEFGMNDSQWEVIETVAGELTAELLKGLLEAQGVPVILSMEGVGRSVYPVNVGKLSQVKILAPINVKEQALQVLKDYYAGNFESLDPDTGE